MNQTVIEILRLVSMGKWHLIDQDSAISHYVALMGDKKPDKVFNVNGKTIAVSEEVEKKIRDAGSFGKWIQSVKIARDLLKIPLKDARDLVVDHMKVGS